MKKKFKLTKLNKILTVLGCALYLFITIAFTPELWTKLAYYQDILGGLLAFIFIPLIFSWIVWIISGRKKFSANLTFTLFLLLMVVLISFIRFDTMAEKIQQEIHPDLARNTAEIRQTTPLGISQYPFFEMTLSDQECIKNWKKSWDALQEPWVFDFSSLQSKEDYDRQREVITEYVKQSKKVKNYLLNMEQRPENRLEKLHKIPLVIMHIQYGNSMLAILSLLEENQGKWTLYQETVPIFREKRLSDEYERLMTNMLAKENAMNTLIEKITATKNMVDE